MCANMFTTPSISGLVVTTPWKPWGYGLDDGRPQAASFAVVQLENAFFSHSLLRILTINCDGLRTKEKSLALGNILSQLHIEICVATESHLPRSELERLDGLKGNKAAAHFCRIAKNELIKGGVVILAITKLTEANVENTEEDGVPLESCAADIIPTNDPAERIRLTGVYIPPRHTAQLTPDILLKCSKVAKTPQTAKNDDELPHLIMGDFNPPGWNNLLEEWCGVEGLWNLANAEIPTCNAGNSVGRVLFITGGHIPHTPLPPASNEEKDAEDSESELFYPARVIPGLAFSDHYPLVLAILCALTKPSGAAERLFLDGLTGEDWMEKDLKLQETL